jgi:hypothetical protein
MEGIELSKAPVIPRQVWLPKEFRLWGIGCDCFAF